MKRTHCILFILLSLCCVTSTAQKKNPRGLYRLAYIEHEDHSRVNPSFTQYKFLTDGCSFTVTQSPDMSYYFSILDHQVFNHTGNVPVGDEGTGLRIYDSSNKAFKLAWYNNKMPSSEIFRYLQFNTEQYVTDSMSSDLKDIVDILTNKKKPKGKGKEIGWWRMIGGTEQERYDTLVDMQWPTYLFYDGQRYTTFLVLSDNPNMPEIAAYPPCPYEVKDQTISLNDSLSAQLDFIGPDKMVFVEPNRSFFQRCGLPLPLQSLFGTQNAVSEYEGTLLPSLAVAQQRIMNGAREMEEYYKRKDYVKYIHTYCDVLKYVKQLEIYKSVVPRIVAGMDIIVNIQQRIDDLAEHGNNLAYEMAEEEKYADAIEILSMVLQLCPDNANLYDSCGEMFLRQDKTDEAVSCYKIVLEKDPDFFKTHSDSVLLKELQERGFVPPLVTP